jgi:hypothetical protein
MPSGPISWQLVVPAADPQANPLPVRASATVPRAPLEPVGLADGLTDGLDEGLELAIGVGLVAGVGLVLGLVTGVGLTLGILLGLTPGLAVADAGTEVEEQATRPRANSMSVAGPTMRNMGRILPLVFLSAEVLPTRGVIYQRSPAFVNQNSEVG